MAELLAVLYGSILRVRPETADDPDRDRLILSKGHGCAGLYAVLAERGFFPAEWLESFYLDGAKLPGHATAHGIPGVEVSTGALGHGLSIACGLALAAKLDARPFRVFTVLSDGECDEGSVWEAAMFAPQHRLDNLVVVVVIASGTPGRDGTGTARALREEADRRAGSELGVGRMVFLRHPSTGGLDDGGVREGEMLVTNDDRLYEFAEPLGTIHMYGDMMERADKRIGPYAEPAYYKDWHAKQSFNRDYIDGYFEVGNNFRMSEVQAAIGLVQPFRVEKLGAR